MTEHTPARIIAAAPDLLAACEDLLAWMLAERVLNQSQVASTDKAKAAIAKARGESDE